MLSLGVCRSVADTASSPPPAADADVRTVTVCAVFHSVVANVRVTVPANVGLAPMPRVTPSRLLVTVTVTAAAGSVASATV